MIFHLEYADPFSNQQHQSYLDGTTKQQAPEFCTLAITSYRYRNSDLASTTAKIVQKVLVRIKRYYYVFGTVFDYLNRSTVLLKSNCFKGCFNQVTFYDFQIFCQGKVLVKIFLATQSLTLKGRAHICEGADGSIKPGALHSYGFFAKWLLYV